MTRSLPSRPNLDHLRNQAKDLLDTARATHPTWQLADAQFALARDYGFPSWPALKAHVDQLACRLGARDKPAPLGPPTDDCPMNGVWVANVAASLQHPAAHFENATLEIRVSGTRVTMTQGVIGTNGQRSASTMTIHADGQPHAPEGGAATHALVARWLDARTLEAVDTRNGAEVGRGHYDVSPDGRTLIVTSAEHRLVFDRR